MPAGAAKALWFVGAVTALADRGLHDPSDGHDLLGQRAIWRGHSDELHHQAEHDGHSPEATASHDPHTPHESPLSMTIPLIVLAVLSTVGGLVGVPYAISSTDRRSSGELF